LIFQYLRECEHVRVGVTPVVDLVDISLDQVDAETADFAVAKRAVQIGLRRFHGIEGDAVIHDRNDYRLTLFAASDMDLVLDFVIETMIDDIGEELIHGQVDFEFLPFGNAAFLAKRRQMLAKHIQIFQSIGQFKLDLGH
jgi:hypothetical protein